MLGPWIESAIRLTAYRGVPGPQGGRSCESRCCGATEAHADHWRAGGQNTNIGRRLVMETNPTADSSAKKVAPTRPGWKAAIVVLAFIIGFAVFASTIAT